MGATKETTMSAPADHTDATVRDPHTSSPQDERPAGGPPPPPGGETAGPLWRRIAGFPMGYFAVFMIVIGVASYTDNLPDSMFAGFAVTIVLGGVIMWLGNLVPVIRDFGLPTILCIFLPAVFVVFGWLPETLITVVQNFFAGYGFLDFFVITIISGTILGMPRALLIKAGPRFVVPIIGCIAATFLIVGAVAGAVGFGFLKGMLFVAAPIMAGGIGIGAIPMSEIYAGALGGAPADFLGQLMSAVVLGNLVCIITAGIYNGLGRYKKQLFVGFNGHGELLRIEGKREDLKVPPKRTAAAYLSLGKGLAIAGVLYVLGQLIGGFADFLHPYAWTIIAAVVVKLLRLLPRELEEAATDWSDLIGSFLVPALLVGVSLTYIDINEVLAALANPTFIPLIVLTVVIAALSAGIIGWLVKFNFVEASIVPGLILADTGGSGDVAVLSAAGRMHLMPFAALTTRLGGALVLFVTSLLATLL